MDYVHWNYPNRERDCMSKNKARRNRIIALTLGLALVASYFLISGMLLNNQGAEASDVFVDEVNEDRSQILVSGSKYSLDNQQEEEFLREQERIQEIKEDKKKEEVEAEKPVSPKEPAESIVKKGEEEKLPEPEEAEKPEEKPEEEREDKQESKPEDRPQDDNTDNPSSDESGEDSQGESEDQQDEESPNQDKPTGKEGGEGDSEEPGDNPGDDTGDQNDDSGDDSGDGDGGEGSGEGDTPGDSDNVNPGDGEDGTGGGEGSGEGEGGDNTGEDPQDPEEINKKPIIECSLSDGVTTSTELRFTLRGVDYKGRTIDPFNYKAWVNGSQVYSSGTEGGYAVYRSTLPEGSYEVTVYVSDSEGNDSSVTYTAYAEGEPVTEGGHAYLTIDMTSIGHGIALETVAEIYEGQSVASFVDTALRQNGFTPYWRSGWYLERIGGVYVDVDSITIPEAYQGSEYLDGQAPDSLGEKDVVATSGWLYYLNGVFMDVGMGGVTLMDGDEVYLYFTLGLYY